MRRRRSRTKAVHLGFVKEAVHCSALEPPHPCPSPPRGRGGLNLNLLPSPPWGRGCPDLIGTGEGVTPERIGKEFPEHPLCVQH